MPTRAIKVISQPAALDLVSISQALLVAKCLSFRRAAAVLGIQQSVISRRMRALEDTLGVSLFERNHAGVRVTAAGVHFFEQTTEALNRIDYAVKTAGTAGCGSIGRLDVGILSSSMAAGFLREVIRIYRARHPKVAIRILERPSPEQFILVERGKLDVALILGRSVIPNCELAQLWTERIFVALPQEHGLCGSKEISWEMLRGEPFIFCQAEKGRVLHDELIKHFWELNDRPRVERFDVGRETLMHLVALRLGLSLATEATAATQFPGVVFRSIAGENAVPFSAVWLPTNDNPAFRRFLSVARNVAQRWRASDTSSCSLPSNK